MARSIWLAGSAGALLSLQASAATYSSAPLYPSFAAQKHAATPSPTLYPSFGSPKKLAVQRHSYETPTGTITIISLDYNPVTHPTSINNRGDIAGYYTDSSGITHGFFLDADGYGIGINALGAADNAYEGTRPSVINDNEVVGGTYVTGGGPNVEGNFFGFTTTNPALQQVTPVNVLAKGNPGESDTVTAINNNGTFAGTYLEPATEIKHVPQGAFLKNKGRATILVAPNGAVSGAVLLNASGTMVFNSTGPNNRTETFVRSPNGTLTRYRIGGNSTAVAINSSGEIAGNYREIATKKYFGYLRSPTGVVTENITGPNGSAPNLIGMNDSGTLLGEVDQADGTVEAYVRASDGTFTKIPVPPSGENEPIGINASGTVVGVTSGSTAGTEVGYIWTPPVN